MFFTLDGFRGKVPSTLVSSTVLLAESARARLLRAAEVELMYCAEPLTGRSKMPTANIGSSWR